MTRRPLRIDGTDLGALQQFTLDVSAEEMSEGGYFVRRVLRGTFSERSEVDHCDPRAGGHDD